MSYDMLCWCFLLLQYIIFNMTFLLMTPHPPNSAFIIKLGVYKCMYNLETWNVSIWWTVHECMNDPGPFIHFQLDSKKIIVCFLVNMILYEFLHFNMGKSVHFIWSSTIITYIFPIRCLCMKFICCNNLWIMYLM